MQTYAAPEATLDTQLNAVAHAERRRLLLALSAAVGDEGTAVDVDDLVEDANLFESVVALRHQHLPKLVEDGYVEWDRDHHRVSPGPQFDEIRPLLELLRKNAGALPAADD